MNWVRTAKAGNDEDGYSEALLGIDEEGWFPLRVRASPYEVTVITDDAPVTGSRISEENTQHLDVQSKTNSHTANE